MRERSPDFFITNGDMIYAGDQCPAEGPTSDWQNIQGNFSWITDLGINWTDTVQVRDVYLKHWPLSAFRFGNPEDVLFLN